MPRRLPTRYSSVNQMRDFVGLTTQDLSQGNQVAGDRTITKTRARLSALIRNYARKLPPRKSMNTTHRQLDEAHAKMSGGGGQNGHARPSEKNAHERSSPDEPGTLHTGREKCPPQVGGTHGGRFHEHYPITVE